MDVNNPLKMVLIGIDPNPLLQSPGWWTQGHSAILCAFGGSKPSFFAEFFVSNLFVHPKKNMLSLSHPNLQILGYHGLSLLWIPLRQTHPCRWADFSAPWLVLITSRGLVTSMTTDHYPTGLVRSTPWTSYTQLAPSKCDMKKVWNHQPAAIASFWREYHITPQNCSVARTKR